MRDCIRDCAVACDDRRSSRIPVSSGSDNIGALPAYIYYARDTDVRPIGCSVLRRRALINLPSAANLSQMTRRSYSLTYHIDSRLYVISSGNFLEFIFVNLFRIYTQVPFASRENQDSHRGIITSTFTYANRQSKQLKHYSNIYESTCGR